MLRKPSCSYDDDDVMQLKQYVHWVLAEPNTKHPRIEWKILAILLISGAIHENRKLMLKSPNSTMVYSLQILQGKITRYCGLGIGGHAGSSLVGGDIRVMKHYFRSSGQLRFFPESLCLFS